MIKSNPFSILGSIQGNLYALSEMILIAQRDGWHKSHDINDYERSMQSRLANRFVEEIPTNGVWSKEEANVWCEAFWALYEMGATLGSDSDYGSSGNLPLWKMAVDKNELIASFVADKMLKYGIPSSAERSFLVHDAVKNDYKETVIKWLSSEAGRSWGEKFDTAGRNIVSYASSLEMLSILEQHGFDLRQVDRHGFLPEVYFLKESNHKFQREVAAQMTNWLEKISQPEASNHIALFAAAVAGQNFAIAKKRMADLPEGADFRPLEKTAKNMLLALSVPGKNRTPLLRALMRKNAKVSLDGVSATGRTLLMEFLANGLELEDMQKAMNWLVPQLTSPAQIGLCKINAQSEIFLEHLLSPENDESRWKLKIGNKSLFAWLYEQKQFDWLSVSKGETTFGVFSRGMQQSSIFKDIVFEEAKNIWQDLSQEPADRKYKIADALWTGLSFRFNSLEDNEAKENWVSSEPVREFWVSQSINFIEATGYQPENTRRNTIWLSKKCHLAREQRLLAAASVEHPATLRPKI